MKRSAEEENIRSEGVKRSKLSHHEKINPSPHTVLKMDEFQPIKTSDIDESDKIAMLEVAPVDVSLLKAPVDVPEEKSNISLSNITQISLPSPCTPYQRSPSVPVNSSPTVLVNPNPGDPVNKLDFSLPSSIPELRAILEKYPQLLRLMPKHTRVGKQYQAQIPPCTKSSRFKENQVIGECYDIKTSIEASLKDRKAMRAEMLLKKVELENRAGDQSPPSECAVSLTSVLGSVDLEEDDSDTDFNYESAKESNTEKACKAEGIIARRLDCLPGERRDQGSAQYLIRWEDGTTEWEYEELLGDEFGELIDDYLYREGLMEYADGDDRETSTECEEKRSPNFLISPPSTAILRGGESLPSIVEPSLKTSTPLAALSPQIASQMKEDVLATVTTTVPLIKSASGGEKIAASETTTNELLP